MGDRIDKVNQTVLDLKSQRRIGPFVHAAFWLSVAVIGCVITGCNPYRTPQSIDPATELKMSESSVAFGAATLRVPRGWVPKTEERFDEQRRPLSVSLVRSDKGRRIAYILFEVLDDRPKWRGNVDVSETSTASHEHVVYDVTETEEPSAIPGGAESPGHFTIEAYFKANGVFWYMHATFFTRVQPDLIDAVNYIDAIVFGEEKEPPETKSSQAPNETGQRKS